MPVVQGKTRMQNGARYAAIVTAKYFPSHVKKKTLEGAQILPLLLQETDACARAKSKANLGKVLFSKIFTQSGSISG